jgi:Flp pilus assembly protein CpaB
VGVRIDEVVGLGGFAEPGDSVDVLVYIPSNRETNDITTASIAIRDARVLAFGDDTLLSPAADAKDSAAEQAKEATGAKALESARDRRLNLKSAVLAVPEQEAARLMLASSQGQIKLALRPPGESNHNMAPAAAPVRTGQTSQTTAPRKGTVTLGELAQAPKPPPAATTPAAPRAPATMEIFEGSTLRKVPL